MLTAISAMLGLFTAPVTRNTVGSASGRGLHHRSLDYRGLSWDAAGVFAADGQLAASHLDVRVFFVACVGYPCGGRDAMTFGSWKD